MRKKGHQSIMFANQRITTDASSVSLIVYLLTPNLLRIRESPQYSIWSKWAEREDVEEEGTKPTASLWTSRLDFKAEC